MPIPDLGLRLTAEERLRIAQDRMFVRRMVDRVRRNQKRPGGEAGESVPVEPSRPSNLSGGAAAALEFDD
jgi:hypothetical protein